MRPWAGCAGDSQGVHDLTTDDETGRVYCQGCDLDAEEIPEDDEVRMT